MASKYHEIKNKIKEMRYSLLIMEEETKPSICKFSYPLISPMTSRSKASSSNLSGKVIDE